MIEEYKSRLIEGKELSESEAELFYDLCDEYPEEIMTTFADKGIPVKYLMEVMDQRFIHPYPIFERLCRFPDQISTGHEWFRRQLGLSLSRHSDSILNHRLYQDLLWKFTHPEDIIGFIETDKYTNFILEGTFTEGLEPYLLACEKYGVEPKGKWYETYEFITENIEESDVTVRMWFHLIDNGMAEELVAELMINSANSDDSYYNYLKHKYGYTIDNRYDDLDNAKMRVIEACYYASIPSRVGIALLYSYGRDGTMLAVNNILATKNYETYASLAPEDIIDIMKESPETELPKDYIGRAYAEAGYL